MPTIETLTPVRATCPKCGHPRDAETVDCPSCGVVFKKLARSEERLDTARSESEKLGGGFSLERLALVDRLMVRQQVDRLEAFIGFEQANSYSVQDGTGNVLFHAWEESSTLMRMLLKSMRPFTLHVSTPSGEPVLTLERPWRFFFAELRVLDSRGQLLGVVTKRWSFVNRLYSLVDSVRDQQYEVYGPFFRPWTFHIRRNGADCGAIRKKWSGALREMFTDSDFFGVEFPRDVDVRLKTVFLGAMFLIDYMHFEDNNRS